MRGQIKKTLPVICGFVLLAVSIMAGSRYVRAASWPDPAYVTLSGNVRLTGDKVTGDIKSGQFQFEVTSENDDLRLPERVNYVESGGSLPLGSYTFTEEGSYVFKIQQVKENVKGYTYDTDAVTAHIKIKKNAQTNQLESTITYQKSGRSVAGIVFTNTYTAAPAASPAETAEPEAAPEAASEAVLETEFTVDHNEVVPGGEVTFSMQFANTGNTMLVGLYIRQYVPDYMLYVKCEENGNYGAIDGREHATWFVAELPPGESVTVWLTCRLYICLPDDVQIISHGCYEVTGLAGGVMTNDPEDPAELSDQIRIKIKE